MDQELLKAIVQLFAIVARDRITDDERTKIKEFLLLHLNRELTDQYIKLFDTYCHSKERATTDHMLSLDEETQTFVNDWAHIIEIIKQVNKSLIGQQKSVLILKIIELLYRGAPLSERQNNLIFYITKALKTPAQAYQDIQQFVFGNTTESFFSDRILIIDNGERPIPQIKFRVVSKHLNGLIVVLHLAEFDVFFLKYLGDDQLHLNAAPMKNQKIEVFSPGSSIRGARIDTIYYSDILRHFIVDEKNVDIQLIADHVFYHFPSGKAALQNINLAESGSKLVAVMGASGSGKSTLFNILNGTEKPSSGRVTLNGHLVHQDKNRVQGAIGYVPQDDLLIEDLTVFENLFYAAKLCFKQYSKEQLNDRVTQILSSLGLSDIGHLKVGSVANKTISGGQRKRLNIGLELLREPTILFVDEPTSGLSSQDSENIMDLLKEVSLRGKMIFVIIHQPSSNIFKMFDRVIILDVGGFQIYYGNPIESAQYFQDIINATYKITGSCPLCGNINPERIFNIIETRVVNEYGRLTRVRKVTPEQWYQYFKQKINIPKWKIIRSPLQVTQEISGPWRQWVTFVTRDVLSKWANSQYVTFNLLLSPILALFIAYFVRYKDPLLQTSKSYTFLNNDNVPIYFFMSLIVSLFVGLTISAEEIYRDRKIVKREKFLQLNRTSYLLSKVTVLFFISAFHSLMFVLIGNSIVGIPLTEIRYVWILFTCACTANMMGLNISSAFNSSVTIYILIPMLIIPQLLLSGVVIRFDKFNPHVGSPKYVPLLCEFIASRWAFEAYMVSQFKDNPFSSQFYDMDQQISMANYKRIYYLPVLESKLDKAWQNRLASQGLSREQQADMTLLKKELYKEQSNIGIENQPFMNGLTTDQFDQDVYQETKDFILTLKKYYNIKRSNAFQKKQGLVRSLTNTSEKKQTFDIVRETYQNEAVSGWVENKNTIKRIIEWQGELVQKISPIYYINQHPTHPLDFRSPFYVASKPFMNRTFDTFYFNLAVIWVMTLLLYVTLHFEVLKKIVARVEKTYRYREKRLKK